MHKLYHFSENGNIEKFIPKKSKALWKYEKYVWAITEDKKQNYIFPRECPRICILNKESSNLKKWISKPESQKYKTHIFVCEDWKEKIENCQLYKYQFENKNFKEIDTIAGYYVSEKIEIPVTKYLIKNPIETLNNLNVNLKFVSKTLMMELKADVIKNTKEFSIIKWGNISSCSINETEHDEMI